MRKIIFAILILLSTKVNAQVNGLTTKNATIKDWIWFDGQKRYKWFGNVNNLRGGVVSWVSGLTFAVTSAQYGISGTDYISNGGQIILDAAHPTLARFDVLALNTSGNIVKITGTAAANPVIPQVDQATQIYLTTISLPAGATTPGGVTSQTVYDENVEWSHAQAGFTGGISFTSTASAYTGTKSIDVTGSGATDVSASGGLKFNDGNTYNYSDFSVIRFYIKLKSAFPAAANIQVALGNGNEQMTVISASQGFNPSIVGTYQNISIPLAEFNKLGLTFTTFYIMINGTGIGYYIDNIQMQSGISSGGGNGYVTNVFKKVSSTDSVFIERNGQIFFAYKDLSGGGGSLTDGNKGDVTVSGGGAVWQINGNAVTKAKIANAAVDTNKTDFGHTESYYSNLYFLRMAAIGVSPNANGATVSGSTITLQPASASTGGVLSVGSQVFPAGDKYIYNGSKFGILPIASGGIRGDLQISNFMLTRGTSPVAGSLRFGDGTGWRFNFGRMSTSSVTNINDDSVYMTIAEPGKVGIGTVNPTEKLEVNGSIKMTDGNQGAGKLMTSDANGKASWQTPTSGGYSSYQIDSIARISVAAQIKNYYFESSTTGLRLFYKKNDSTIHFISAIASSGIKIDITLDANSDTVYSFSVDPTVFVNATKLTDSLNAVRTLVSSKQNTLALTTTGTGSASIVGNVLNIPTPVASVDTLWTVNHNANQKDLSNVRSLEVKRVGAGAATYSTFNPADKAASPTLSGGNLTATGSGSFTTGMLVRSVDTLTDGTYVEFKLNVAGSSNFGISPSSEIYNDFVGAGSGYIKSTGNTYKHNNTDIFTGTASADGDVIMMAFKSGAIYFGRNGTWENSGNPAAGTGYIYNAIPGTYYVAYSNYNSTGNVTLNTGATAFTYTMPSGFHGLYSTIGSGLTTNTLKADSGKVSINSAVRDSALHVDGGVVLNMPSKGAGKVLVGDANGALTFQTYNGVTVQANATDANFTATVNSFYKIPAGILTTGRTITIPAGVAGNRLYIFNRETTFTVTLSGSAVYLSDETTQVTTLPINWITELFYVDGKWQVLL